MRRFVLLSLAVFVATPIAPSAAYHDDHGGHSCPLAPTESQDHFHPRFAPPWDAETRSRSFAMICGTEPWRVAGFGGERFRPMPGEPAIPATCDEKRPPVIFVHGNGTDAGDWYPALRAFADIGYTMCDLWGLSFNGVGANGPGAALHTRNDLASEERGEAGDTIRTTNHEKNVPDLTSFIEAVLRFTGARRYAIVGHSLGVTLGRKALEETPSLLRRLDVLVGISGGNHGTSVCRGNEPLFLYAPERSYFGCDELAPDTPPIWENEWLAELNAGDETPGRARYLTVYDGSGTGDPYFSGPDSESPRLDGALNCRFAGAYHNDLRVDHVISGFYAAFVLGRKLPAVDAGATPSTMQGVECDEPAWARR
ncbi:MAG: alpha/beta fold hydrolase [Actinomycetota bacterium]